MADQEVEKTILLYEALVKDFPTPESWAVNILTASKKLTSGIAQTNFYRYLFDPEHYSFQKNIKNLIRLRWIGPFLDKKSPFFDFHH